MKIGSSNPREFLLLGAALTSAWLAGVPVGAQPLRLGPSSGTL
jgi:hypothetical protein